VVVPPVSPALAPSAYVQHQPVPVGRAALAPALAAQPVPPAAPPPRLAGGELPPAVPPAALGPETEASRPAQGPAVKLVFVYNADAGPLNGFKDLLHKTFSPDTYECALCANTYQFSGMRPEWKQAVANLPLPTEFLHRDEFRRAYPALASHSLPAAFSADAAGHLAPFISTQELDELTLPALIALTQQRAQALVTTP